MLAGNKIALLKWQNEFKDHLVDIAIWDKKPVAPAYPKNVMNSAFEFIFIFANKVNPSRAISSGHSFRGTFNNIYSATGNKQNEFAKVHNAVFPIHLPENFINTFSKQKDLVVDPFGGVGTTLIACEKNNRISYNMELCPLHCQVIIDRYKKFVNRDDVKKIN